jgi:hypothetical protein
VAFAGRVSDRLSAQLPMPRTAPLFDDLESTPAASPGAAALRVLPAEAAALSAAARAFNLQLVRIDKLKSQLQELDTLAQAHRLALHRGVTPLQQRHDQAMRTMARFLEGKLSDKALTTLQRETARQILCILARTLAEAGDADMAALHDRHSPDTLAAQAQARAAELRAQIEDALGSGLDDLSPGASPDEVLHAGMARLRQAAAEEQARRSAAAARRKAKRKPAAAQAAAQAGQVDAESSLRTLFRQLASALHPDREPDPQVRLAKTAWMGEANAAYERRDLVALLQIQQRALGADPQAAARLSDDRLAALTLLLKQQVADLERERVRRHDQLGAEFQIEPGFGVTTHTLQMVLNEQVAELEQALTRMDQDLVRVQDNDGLKRWLTEQRNESRRQQRERDQDDVYF